MAGRLRFYTYEVIGRGNFPFAMLPYDNAWPRDEHANLRGKYDEPKRTIRMAGIKPPAKGRWESFGWKVENVERPYMTYPTKADLAETNVELEERVSTLIEGIKRFYVAWAPHLPASWKEHFNEMLGDETPFLGRGV